MRYSNLKMKLTAFAFLLLIVIQVKFCSEGLSRIGKSAPAAPDSQTAVIDLKEIKKRGKLIALTDNSSTSYFVYKGELMGYEYEMLNSFAKHLGVELQIVVAKNMDRVFDQLNNQEADVVAANLTVTAERLGYVNFSEPLLQTRQVLIQRKPRGWEQMNPEQIDKKLIRNVNDLVGKKIYVRKGSSFYSRLQNLSEEIGKEIEIIEARGEQETEELIQMVAAGEIEFTVADENVAMLNKTYYPNIDVKTAISFPQKISWAVRKDSPELLSALNTWLNKKKNSAEFSFLYSKYFRSPKHAEERMESLFCSLSGSRISCYDEFMKTCSRKLGWDWKLLASVVYQESRFDPDALSWAGAYGLMQMIPAASVRYGIDSISATPEQSLRAGTAYLKNLDNYWRDYIFDKQERTKFVLASYNVGLGHIIDARNLAIKYNKNPNEWEDNVGFFILMKSKPRYYNDPVVKFGYCRGQEPYRYVKEILNRYAHYRNVIKDIPEQELAIGNEKKI